MDTLNPLLSKDLADESGVTAIEYGLLAALIAVFIAGAVGLTGDSLSKIFEFWSQAVNAAIGGAL